VERLADDHARARHIAAAVATVRPELIDPAGVETNIVVLSAPDLAAAQVAAAAREQGVLVSALGPRTVRLVTHLDVDDARAERAAGVLASVVR
jgi:threonine aldolase